MKTDTALQLLNANKDRVAIFISDPIQGDQIVITSKPVLLPRSCEGTDIDLVSNFLLRLDFGIYEGHGPKVTVLPV